MLGPECPNHLTNNGRVEFHPTQSCNITLLRGRGSRQHPPACTDPCHNVTSMDWTIKASSMGAFRMLALKDLGPDNSIRNTRHCPEPSHRELSPDRTTGRGTLNQDTRPHSNFSRRRNQSPSFQNRSVRIAPSCQNSSMGMFIAAATERNKGLCSP